MITPEKTYEAARPPIPAEVRRSIVVESGHCCAIKEYPEHTYLEIHHIDQNRDNNKIENLILLCDKHHKMAHKEVIDRKTLRQYKTLLGDSLKAHIDQKFQELAELIENAKKNSCG